MKEKLRITDKGFFMGDKEYKLYSGAMHYFRIHPDYWRDRLLRLKACGLNTVETYIAWNVQEPRKDEFTFDGFADFEKFLSVAQELGLYAVVRPGPFICAEWSMGGFPAWLLEIDGIQLRRFNRQYIERVDKYFDEIIKRVVPHLTTNGGNVIAVQVENEYGGFGAEDKEYLEYLKTGLIKRGVDVPLFTSDGVGNGDLERGSLDGIFMTANFGSRYKQAFERLKALQPDKPCVCMELWNTWFDQWGKPRHKRNAESVIGEVEGIIKENGGFNLYMFHGGTNFGFMNGSNCNPVFEPTITSYDYGAALNEYGGYTPTYMAIRELMQKYGAEKLPDMPPENERKAYGKAEFNEYAPVFDILDKISVEHKTDRPYNMEHFGQLGGYILYTFNAEGKKGRLDIGEPRDRAMVFADNKYIGVMERDGQVDEIIIENAKEIRIFVENQGYVNFGQRIYDKKGILEYIKVGSEEIKDIVINCIPMDFKSVDIGRAEKAGTPMLYKGKFNVDKKADTFVNPDGFTRGVILINGFNIGRYNCIGPQKTLYIPAPLLNEGENEITVLDLYPKGISAEFIERHILDEVSVQ